MTLDVEDKLCFLVCWNDKQSGLQRDFHLYFYPGSSSPSVEMFDIKTRKVFLKKTETDKISRGDLYIGNTILLYARSLKVLDYGDEVTRETCSQTTENTLGLVKPEAVEELGQILSRIRLEGITLARARMVHLTRHQAEHFYSRYRLDTLFEDLVTDLSAEVCVVMELVGNNVLQKWLSIISLKDSPGSEETVSDVHNRTVYGSSNKQEAEEDIGYFFPKSRLLSSERTPTTRYLAQTNNTSCCVIRPHAYNMAGDIIQSILGAGFQIAALETFFLDFGKADEFLEIYKGVIDHYGDVVKEMSSGACIALQIVQSEDPQSVVSTFREICGPQDPAMAKTLRPKTLRARFGDTLVRNGVHCTDLTEDGPLEVEYFFRVLQ